MKVEIELDMSQYEQLGPAMPKIIKRGVDQTAEYMIENQGGTTMNVISGTFEGNSIIKAAGSTTNINITSGTFNCEKAIYNTGSTITIDDITINSTGERIIEHNGGDLIINNGTINATGSGGPIYTSGTGKTTINYAKITLIK